MDVNKLQQLKSNNYTIFKTCGFCKHGQFPNDSWGTCAKLMYEHQKHSDTKRHLSIYIGGRCAEHFELDETKTLLLGAFKEFLL